MLEVTGYAGYIPYTGHKDGRPRKTHFWICLCDCGRSTVIQSSSFGKQKSCSCADKDRTPEFHKILVDSAKKRWRDGRWRGIPHTIEAKVKMQTAAYRRIRTRGVRTQWELYLADWMDSRGIPFIAQFQINGSGHPFDFLIATTGLIVELDGCYWHGCQRCFPRRPVKWEDAVNSRNATEAGFQMLRIWEHDKPEMTNIISRVLGLNLEEGAHGHAGA